MESAQSKEVLQQRITVLEAEAGVARRVRQELEQKGELLKLFIEHTPAAVAMCDLNMCYLTYSRRWALDYGVGDGNLTGQCHYDVFQDIPAKWKQEHQQCFAGRSIINEEEAFPRRDGSLDWVRRELHPWRRLDGEIGGLIMFTEVITGRKKTETEKKRVEYQLHQAQKMESIGILAGGVAHDFNNLLMGIQGRTSLMLMNSEPSDPHYEHLNKIEEYIQSATSLTGQLLGFARGGKYEVKTSQMNELIRKSIDMFGRTKKEISLHLRLDDSLWSVEVDTNQIVQVLLNLFVNAGQAMPYGGDLYIQTGNLELTRRYLEPYDLDPGRYVKVSVTDTGIGMDEKTMKSIFDPFFTTKELGRGTGLGLASVYGIMKNHRGLVNVYSELGNGSTFNLYLPASDKKIMEEQTQTVSELENSDPITILLVDDEPFIQDVGQEILEHLGHQVLVAGNGMEAVKKLEENQAAIDLVILDMIMPEMGGGEVFDHFKAVDPDVRVLLSSGYSINGQAQNIIDKGCVGFIQKPFTIIQLRQKLREIQNR